jgi:hypothetical protein
MFLKAGDKLEHYPPGGIIPAPWVTVFVFISKNFYALREQDK